MSTDPGGAVLSGSTAPGAALGPRDGTLAGPVALPDARRTPPVEPLKVVYVLGSWRSGSTILGVLLGTHPQIQTTGELSALPARFRDSTRVCSCGVPAAKCEFWSVVWARCRGRVDLEALQAGQRRYEHYPSLPRTALSALVGSPALRAHERRTVDFQRIIAETAEVPVLVDLSKHPVRGLVRKLARPYGLDPYFLHIVRDGRAVMYSRLTRSQGGQFRPVVKNAWGMTVRWVLVNLLSTILCGRPRNRYLRVRYEELLANPEGTLTRVGEFLQMDMSGLVRAVVEEASLPIDHLIDANRLRFRPAVHLAADLEWRTKLPAKSQSAFWLVAGWLAQRYGYRRSS